VQAIVAIIHAAIKKHFLFIKFFLSGAKI